LAATPEVATALTVPGASTSKANDVLARMAAPGLARAEEKRMFAQPASAAT
jgi:hypothetical protein